MRVAVIGCGKQGQRHLAAFARLPPVDGLCVFDADGTRAEAAASRFGAVVAPSLDDAVDGADAVVIAVPTGAHLEIARRSVAAGRHFLCEKPFGADAGAARRIAEDAEEAGVVGRVGYLYRFVPAIAAAREAVRDLGAIETARFAIAAPGSHAAWKHRRAQGGGAINELASHMIDLAVWFFGAPDGCEIVGKSRHLARREIDGAVVAADAEDRIVMRFNRNVAIEADFAAPRFAQEIEIRGARGVLRASIDGAPDLYRLQALDFLAAIAGARGAGCDLGEAARVAELLEIVAVAPMAAA